MRFSIPQPQWPIAILIVSLATITQPTPAKEHWVGIYASNNSGISYKDWIDRNQAYDYGVGWSFDEETMIHAKADYLTHNYRLIDVPEGKLPVYYGAGAAIALGSDFVAGVRLPVGVNYLFQNAPYDVFIEVAPALLIFPSTEITVYGAIGVRYHFRLN